MRLILQFCLLLLVLLGAETHAWGKVGVGQYRVWGSAPDPGGLHRRRCAASPDNARGARALGL